MKNIVQSSNLYYLYFIFNLFLPQIANIQIQILVYVQIYKYLHMNKILVPILKRNTANSYGIVTEILLIKCVKCQKIPNGVRD